MRAMKRARKRIAILLVIVMVLQMLSQHSFMTLTALAEELEVSDTATTNETAQEISVNSSGEESMETSVETALESGEENNNADTNGNQTEEVPAAEESVKESEGNESEKDQSEESKESTEGSSAKDSSENSSEETQSEESAAATEGNNTAEDSEKESEGNESEKDQSEESKESTEDSNAEDSSMDTTEGTESEEDSIAVTEGNDSEGSDHNEDSQVETEESKTEDQDENSKTEESNIEENSENSKSDDKNVEGKTEDSNTEDSKTEDSSAEESKPEEIVYTAGSLTATDGRTYEITVTYDEKAMIPATAVLAVFEITSSEAAYESYAEETMEAAGLEPENVNMIRLFDITIVNPETGEEYQPQSEVNVVIRLLDEEVLEEDLSVVHFGETPEVMETTVVDGDIAFDTEGFSVYSVVQAPPPMVPEGIPAESMTDLVSTSAAKGFYLSVYRDNQEQYFSSTLNGSSAFVETKAISSAAVWFLEAADSSGNRFYMATDVNGVRQYVYNKSGNLAGLSTTEKTVFDISVATSGRFYIKIADQKKWVQHSNSGNGIRFYTDNNNANNCRIAMTFAESFEINEDPYGFDGMTYGLMNYSNSIYGEGLMAAAVSKGLEARSMAVRIFSTGDRDTYYVARNSSLTQWTFHYAGKDTYQLSSGEGDARQYLTLTGGVLGLGGKESATAFSVIPGTDEFAGALRLVCDGYAVIFKDNIFKTDTDKATDAREYLNLVELSELTDEDFVIYSAAKVSVSDASQVTNGSRVILYTRTWDEQKKRYFFWAVDHNGDLVPCSESGDVIQWIGTKLNTLLWNVTEYYDEVTGEPNYYYELKNPYSGNFIAPQITDGKVLSKSPVGINMDGRRYGQYYTTLIAWDDPYYAYAGVKAENGKIVSCSFSEAEDFYFALLQDAPPAGELIEIPTVDHTQYGITMKLIDFGNNNSKQNTFLGSSSGGLNAPPTQGLLSTNLGEDGYPVAASGSLGLLFAGAQEVNHLFAGSTYQGSAYYEYDSTQNFASIRPDGNFVVYKELGTTDLSDRASLKHGQFFPFDDLDPTKFASVNNENLYTAEMTPLEDSDPRKYEPMYLISKPNYYFGVEIEAAFVQTPNGLDAWGHDIVYEFTGDDDFWLYVDGELVIDLGGIHSALPGTVNFSTGEVSVYSTKTTLREIFRSNYIARGLTEKEINEKLDEIFELKASGNYVFKDYSTHTMRIFFMERGAGASNLHMRFNLASVKPGQILLSKEISGTEKADYALAEYAFQIWYEVRGENGQYEWRRLDPYTDTQSAINVAYLNSNIPTRYTSYYVPAGGNTGYGDVYLLSAGQTVTISLPEDTIRYQIVECGVSTQVYDNVYINDVQAAGSDNGSGRKDFATTPAMISERARVTFNNHVSPEAKRTLTIQNLLFDAEDKYVSDDPTGFTFRLSLGGENEQNLTPAGMQEYYVKDSTGAYCRWDASAQRFVSIGKYSFDDLSTDEKRTIVYYTSMNGAISKIPGGYSIEVRDLLVGTRFRIEEKASEVPAGYSFIRYAREAGTYFTEAGEDVNYGIIRDNANPIVEVHNRRGFGLTVQVSWSDEAYMLRHGDVYTAVYAGGKLIENTVRLVAQNKVYYYWDVLPEGAESLDDLIVREVKVNGENVEPIEEGGILSVSAQSKEENAEAIYDYSVSYMVGTPSGTAANVRTDLISNDRFGVRLVVVDENGKALPGAVFHLVDADGRAVGSELYTSDEYGLITVAYIHAGSWYSLEQVKAPGGYVGLETVVQFRTDIESGKLEIMETIAGTTISQGEDQMATLEVRNIPFELAIQIVGRNVSGATSPLANAHFALHREVSVDQVTAMDYEPIEGFEDLVSDENGYISGISSALPAGTYYLKQLKTQDSFRKITTPIRFTIDEMGRVNLTDHENAAMDKEATDKLVRYSIIIENVQELPAPTGYETEEQTRSSWVLLAAGLALALTLIIPWLLRKKRTEEE